MRAIRVSGLVALFFVLGCAAHRSTPLPVPVADETLVIERIAFGSCAHQDKQQRVWRAMAAYNPDLTLLLGDNVYADTDDRPTMQAIYQKWAENPDFAAYRARFPILATWDDHDYGLNDGGADFHAKDMAKSLFLGFWGYDKYDARTLRLGNYDAVTFGPSGKRVQVILLDTRYHRSPLERKPEDQKKNKYDRYFANTDPEATILGEDQWQWLEEQLRQPADLRLLVSSIQVLPDEAGAEYWGNFPLERQRLFQLIRDTDASGVVMLSGDKHSSELSRMARNDADGVGYPLYDFTGSGLTENWGQELVDTPNRYRVGKGLALRNFTTITIDWAQAMLDLAIHHEDGRVYYSHRVAMPDLRR